MDHQAQTGRQYPIKGFNDLFFHGSEANQTQHLQIDLNSKFTAIPTDSTECGNPWQQASILQGQLYDPHHKKMTEVNLVPMGSTILRKVSFDVV
jgi:hypothetical protein